MKSELPDSSACDQNCIYRLQDGTCCNALNPYRPFTCHGYYIVKPGTTPLEIPQYETGESQH